MSRHVRCLPGDAAVVGRPTRENEPRTPRTTPVVGNARIEGFPSRTTGRGARRAAALTFSPDLVPVDLAVREWARRDPGVAQRLRRVDDERMGYLRATFRDRFPDPDDLEARCLLALASSLIVAEHPGRTRAEVVDRAARLVFGDDGERPGSG